MDAILKDTFDTFTSSLSLSLVFLEISSKKNFF